MTLEEALFLILEAETDIVSLIGDADHFRVYRQMVPQHGRFPCAVIQRTTTARDVGQCGTFATTRAVVQIDGYATTPEQAAQVGDAIRYALVDFSGTIQGALRIKVATLENESDLNDPEPGLYRRSQSWTVWFAEL